MTLWFFLSRFVFFLWSSITCSARHGIEFTIHMYSKNYMFGIVGHGDFFSLGRPQIVFFITSEYRPYLNEAVSPKSEFPQNSKRT